MLTLLPNTNQGIGNLECCQQYQMFPFQTFNLRRLTEKKQGHPLYSNRKSLKWSSSIKYLCQNGNLDICVADGGANAIVVVSAAGKLRFRYTGSPSNPYEEFFPCYITTDSENRILISETEKSQIHLVDQDGNFLRLFDNCGLQGVTELCVDSRDNLFVVEQTTGKVKKIQ